MNLSSHTNFELAAGTAERCPINCGICDTHTGWEHKTTTQWLTPTSVTKEKLWVRPVGSHHRAACQSYRKMHSDLCVCDYQIGLAYSAGWKFRPQPYEFWCNRNFLLALKSLYLSSLREGIIIWKGLRDKNKTSACQADWSHEPGEDYSPHKPIHGSLSDESHTLKAKTLDKGCPR